MWALHSSFFCKCEQVVNMFKLQSWKNFLVHAHEIEFCHKIFQTCLKIQDKKVATTCLKIQDKKVAMVHNRVVVVVVVFVNGRNQTPASCLRDFFFFGVYNQNQNQNSCYFFFF
jgi:hypothetical protein